MKIKVNVSEVDWPNLRKFRATFKVRGLLRFLARLLGVPADAVVFVNPSGHHYGPHATLGDIRNAWDVATKKRPKRTRWTETSPAARRAYGKWMAGISRRKRAAAKSILPRRRLSSNPANFEAQ